MGRKKLNPDTGHRICRVCRAEKPISEFYSHKGQPLNKSYMCKDCDKSKHSDFVEKSKGILKLRAEVDRLVRLTNFKRLIIMELEMEDRHAASRG